MSHPLLITTAGGSTELNRYKIGAACWRRWSQGGRARLNAKAHCLRATLCDAIGMICYMLDRVLNEHNELCHIGVVNQSHRGSYWG